MNHNTCLLKMLLFIALILPLSSTSFAISNQENTDEEPSEKISLNKHSNIDSKLADILAIENKNQLMIALTHARTLFDEYPSSKLARIYYGRLLIKNGLSKDALIILQPLATEITHDWQPWFWLGTAQLLEDDLDNAAFSLDEALAREGNIISLWVQRAIVEQERGTPSSALHLLQVADGIAPGNSDVMINYAYASELSGDIKQATIIYKRFLQQTASLKKYGRTRSQLFYRLNKFEQAKKTQLSTDKSKI